jgi:hypothetical protein
LLRNPTSPRKRGEVSVNPDAYVAEQQLQFYRPRSAFVNDAPQSGRAHFSAAHVHAMHVSIV